MGIGNTKTLSVQKKHQWDLVRDLDFEQDLIQGQFIPLSADDVDPSLVAFSQFLGLFINSVIASHEKSIARFQENITGQLKTPIDREFAREFFLEESKHSKAFRMFNLEVLKQRNVSKSLHGLFFPEISHGQVVRFFLKLNKLKWQGPLWSLVVYTEEISLSIFRYIRKFNTSTNAGFYRLHRLHFEEEIRHQSFPKFLQQQSSSLFRSTPLNSLMIFTNMALVCSQFFKALLKIRQHRHQDEFCQLIWKGFKKYLFCPNSCEDIIERFAFLEIFALRERR